MTDFHFLTGLSRQMIQAFCSFQTTTLGTFLHHLPDPTCHFPKWCTANEHYLQKCFLGLFQSYCCSYQLLEVRSVFESNHLADLYTYLWISWDVSNLDWCDLATLETCFWKYLVSSALTKVGKESLANFPNHLRLDQHFAIWYFHPRSQMECRVELQLKHTQ